MKVKIPFEDIDDKDFTANADQTLSFSEKALIRAGLVFVKILTWKVKRIKTYGDIYNIVKWFKINSEKLNDNMEAKFSRDESEPTEEGINAVIEEINDFADKFDKEVSSK